MALSTFSDLAPARKDGRGHTGLGPLHFENFRLIGCKMNLVTSVRVTNAKEARGDRI